jgi:hypothetical protein
MKYFFQLYYFVCIPMTIFAQSTADHIFTNGITHKYVTVDILKDSTSVFAFYHDATMSEFEREIGFCQTNDSVFAELDTKIYVPYDDTRQVDTVNTRYYLFSLNKENQNQEVMLPELLFFNSIYEITEKENLFTRIVSSKLLKIEKIYLPEVEDTLFLAKYEVANHQMEFDYSETFIIPVVYVYWSKNSRFIGSSYCKLKGWKKGINMHQIVHTVRNDYRRSVLSNFVP